MDFVLGLHSHLPYVLNHGRWPHGSDWITEAAVDTYLPLIDSLLALAEEEIAAPVTVGITPILANQLASPVFESELRQFFKQRLEACDEAEAEMATSHDAHLIPVVGYWRDTFRIMMKNCIAAGCTISLSARYHPPACSCLMPATAINAK